MALPAWPIWLHGARGNTSCERSLCPRLEIQTLTSVEVPTILTAGAGTSLQGYSQSSKTHHTPGAQSGAFCCSPTGGLRKGFGRASEGLPLYIDIDIEC